MKAVLCFYALGVDDCVSEPNNIGKKDMSLLSGHGNEEDLCLCDHYLLKLMIEITRGVIS